MRLWAIVVAFVVIDDALSIYLNSSSRAKEENPAYWSETEIWGPFLEEYTLRNHREKRVMRLSKTEIYVKSNRRSDNQTAQEEKESKIAPGKIVNNSYNHYNNVRPKPQPGREVSETDLYLLNAIEKLVYRVDFMEKRLRKVEEMMYFVMAGNRIDQEPCPKDFLRAGVNCYYFGNNAGREVDWQVASKMCKKMGATLAEMETIEENQDVVALIQITPHLKGKDFWTGGLNPGLLWIWSNSARPIPQPGKNDKNKPVEIPGEGRCLRLAYDPALKQYNYRGTDCGIRHHFICELPESNSSNQINKIGRSMKIFEEVPKINDN